MQLSISYPMLLATDQHSSFLTRCQREAQFRFAYCAFGHAPAAILNVLPAFNGQWAEAQTRVYLLGNGFRALNSVLMRFHSPDSLSPFGDGGLNTYAYCAGDPVNNIDPSGHIFKRLRRFLGIKPSPKANSVILTRVKPTTPRVPSVSSNGTLNTAEPIAKAVSPALPTPPRSASPPPPIQDISAKKTVTFAPASKPPSRTHNGNIITKLSGEEAAKYRDIINRARAPAPVYASRSPVATGQGSGLNFPPGLSGFDTNVNTGWVRGTTPNYPWR